MGYFCVLFQRNGVVSQTGDWVLSTALWSLSRLPFMICLGLLCKYLHVQILTFYNILSGCLCHRLQLSTNYPPNSNVLYRWQSTDWSREWQKCKYMLRDVEGWQCDVWRVTCDISPQSTCNSKSCLTSFSTEFYCPNLEVWRPGSKDRSHWCHSNWRLWTDLSPWW